MNDQEVRPSIKVDVVHLMSTEHSCTDVVMTTENSCNIAVMANGSHS